MFSVEHPATEVTKNVRLNLLPMAVNRIPCQEGEEIRMRAAGLRAFTTHSLDHPLPLLAREFGFLAFLKRQPYRMPP